MNIYIYSDESGVFDKSHNDIFVFGGVIVLGNDERDTWSRKYSRAEKVIRERNRYPSSCELKATFLSNGDKAKLFRSLNNCYKFGVIVNQNQVLDNIFHNKKTKQRYLDYVYKIGVKRALKNLIDREVINPSTIENIYFYVDEHTTATDGRYELQEALEQELKVGTYNYNYSIFYEPIIPNLKAVKVNFCNSEKKYLVRAADIIANRLYYLSTKNLDEQMNAISNIYILQQP